MYRVAKLNKISTKGTALLTEKYELTDSTDGATAILVRSADMLEMELPEELLTIARAGAGVNNIPVEKCTELGIVVFNTPGANANAVKELVIAGMLMASRNIPAAIEWTKTLTEDAAKTVETGKSQFSGEEIKGKTLGVVGLGYIGVMVANAAESLGMKVVGYDPYISLKAAHVLSSTVKLYDKLPSMLPGCDYVSIHIPSNKDTNGMFGYELLETMKSSAVLLNFSRDKLVVSEDLKRALDEKKLRYYITDFPTDEMLGLEGVMLIPHLGASTGESEDNCAVMAVEEIMDYLENGNIYNSVNFPSIDAGKKEAGPRIVALHKNIPGMLGTETSALAEMGVNISDLVNKSKGDYACTIVDCDGDIDDEAVKKAFAFEGMISVRIIR